jgi:hypothetical protein
VKYDLPRNPSELVYRIRNSASAQMWITLAVAVTFALGVNYWSRATACGRYDGQCGMSTFFGAAFGYVGGFIIFMGVGARVLYVDLKRRRARPVRVKDKSAADEAHDFGAALFQDRLTDDP